jgi:hypothetical protein
MMEKCYNCPDQVLCGGGCPLYANTGHHSIRRGQRTAVPQIGAQPAAFWVWGHCAQPDAP